MSQCGVGRRLFSGGFSTAPFATPKVRGRGGGRSEPNGGDRCIFLHHHMQRDTSAEAKLFSRTASITSLASKATEKARGRGGGSCAVFGVAGRRGGGQADRDARPPGRLRRSLDQPHGPAVYESHVDQDRLVWLSHLGAARRGRCCKPAVTKGIGFTFGIYGSRRDPMLTM